MEYAFLLDMSRCIGCEACVVACKSGNELPIGTQYIDLIEKTSGTFPELSGGFLNQRCLHCGDAACVSVCPTGALFKEDGLTRLNQGACSGCGYCVQACPYDVPKMVDGHSTKCDGCASTVASGGSPWCVQTCPAQALRYDTRETILAEAHRRVDAIKGRYPNAQVYGETQAGGLGMILVLPDDPQTLDLPLDPPPVPAVTGVWKNFIQPASMAATAVAAVGAGVLGIIARRNHMAELREIEEGELVVAGASDTGASASNGSDTEEG